MARRRPNMSDRLSGPASDTTNNVTPITRGRDAFTAEAAPATAEGTAAEVSVDLIDPSPDNPRSDLGDLKDLAASIKEVGVLQPILVRPNGDRYDVIYGHRRLAAAKLAKLATVPVLFAGKGDETQDRAQRLVENLHREDLSALDEARAYEQLLALGVTGGQRGLAKLVGKSQAHVSKRLGLLQLPAEVQEHVDSGRISLTDATTLSKLSDEPDRLARAVKDGLAYGGIGRAVAREEAEAEREAEQQRRLGELRAAGVSVIDDPRPYNREDGPVPLNWLPWVDVDQHASASCHAATLTPSSWQGGIVLLCVNPQAHADPDEKTRSDQRAREEAERKAEEEARYQARTERWNFAGGLVTKGTPGEGAALAAHQWLGGGYVHVNNDAVAELLGLSPDTFNGKDTAEAVRAYVAKGTRNAQRAVYAIAIALAEGSMDSAGYDGADYRRQRAYLDHLVAAGYTLSRFDRQDLDEIDEALTEFDADLDGESEAGEA